MQSQANRNGVFTDRRVRLELEAFGQLDLGFRTRDFVGLSLGIRLHIGELESTAFQPRQVHGHEFVEPGDLFGGQMGPKRFFERGHLSLLHQS